MEEQTYGKTFTRRGRTHGGDIFIEGTYTWRDRYRGIYTWRDRYRGIYTWRAIHGGTYT